MRFDFVSNSKVHHLHSIDNKNMHFNIFAFENMNISHIKITSPEGSPNTFGIHIATSNDIKISRSIIGTGDDCIAMITGSRNIDVSDVYCGPGHIGSIGRSPDEDPVTGVIIKDCTLNNTKNDVPIKTWAPSFAGLVSDLTFKNIFMDNVNNPIIIDQQYCPGPYCEQNDDSLVQIANVTFSNIRGTSSSEVAITLNCSKTEPCKGIKPTDIDLPYTRGSVMSSCLNVMGEAYGKKNSMGCL